MSQETLSTAAAIGTFVVIAATAIAAVVQLHHLRASNQLHGLLTVLARVEDANFNEWIDGTRAVLNTRISDPAFRQSVVDATFERHDNPWLNLANSYEWVRILVKNRLIDEAAFMDLQFGRVQLAWDLLKDIIAITRQRSNAVWENFEFLAVRADAWEAAYPNGNYPPGLARKDLPFR